jgi:hypothetical protein
MPDVDPATLTDEELDAALGTTPEPEEPETPELDAETTTPETPEPATPEAPEAETPEETEEKPPSRRETLRIKQVLEKRAANNKREPEQPKTARQDALDYEAELDAPPEILQRLKDDREAESRASYLEGLKHSSAMEWRTMVMVDTPRVESKYAFLDPKSPEYHPVITEAMYHKYLAFVGYDEKTGFVERPNVRFSDYVDAEYELADEMASLKSKDTAKHIAKQANQTGLRPDGSAPKRLNLNQDPSSMTDEELDAIIGQAIPPMKKR